MPEDGVVGRKVAEGEPPVSGSYQKGFTLRREGTGDAADPRDFASLASYLCASEPRARRTPKRAHFVVMRWCIAAPRPTRLSNLTCWRTDVARWSCTAQEQFEGWYSMQLMLDSNDDIGTVPVEVKL